MTNDKTNVSEVVRFEAERFRRLVDAVEATPDAGFDMLVIGRKMDCGTVGCAFGNYAIRNPQQLRVEWEFGWLCVNGASGTGMYSVAAKHFGIGLSESKRLFAPEAYEEYPTRENVLARLRSFYAARVPDPRPDPHAMRLKYAAMSDAELAVRTDASVDAGKLDGVLAQRTTRDEGRAVAWLALSMSRATTPAVTPYPAPRLASLSADDFKRGHADAEGAVPA